MGESPAWRMRLSVSRAHITGETTPMQGSLELVVRAHSRQAAIASVRLASELHLPDGRDIGLERYLPVSLRETTRRATEVPTIVRSKLRPRYT